MTKAARTSEVAPAMVDHRKTICGFVGAGLYLIGATCAGYCEHPLRKSACVYDLFAHLGMSFKPMVCEDFVKLPQPVQKRSY
jgi:hypothetical protein